uniref:Class II aldolase/adducin N-terminal domain-containing protein n=1 Tax=Chromera velia CCMP2878 TaxID=1169474 RepID=A0A0G4HTV9_9ALVE|eukprot:Cvel_8539.t1-p1 / transcript=Cvel_8539.t1 / gene=Cvel_8539 / organism=Chromera_velia_CCMP2878 / gene_product=Glyoxylate reductase, putative / transcript_product=Glyoxylate reductase, putative / location=Cvel_scaffold473:51092-54210(+) / protein_length=839 / sequence_SO=supercontig / SO=protein_coding / is_pseudo=false
MDKIRKQYEESVVQQYDTDVKRKFYSAVMGDGTDNIHFGKWEGVDMDKEGAYGEASARMTDWMWRRAMQIHQQKQDGKIEYVDLGSGTGAAARLICRPDPKVSCTCLNLCENQNEENTNANKKEGIASQVDVCKGSYMELPEEWTAKFDGCFSQDAFVHAFSKHIAFSEALRVTKGGGWLVFSDLMKGDAPGVSEDELQSFGQTNMVADWLTPAEVCRTLTEAGWQEVSFEDLTLDIKRSFQLMLRKVNRLLQDPKACSGIDLELLETYKNNLTKRVGQVDRGVFKWGCVSARKPYVVSFLSHPPVNPQPVPLCDFRVGPPTAETDVVAVTIKEPMDKARIQALPPSVRLIVSLSSGLDHIDQTAAAERDIQVVNAGKDAIVKASADYALSLIVFSLRGGFAHTGTQIPREGWSLGWHAEGVSMEAASIGVVGLGRIARSLIERLRSIEDWRSCRILYCVPPQKRDPIAEKELDIEWMPLEEMLPQVDILVPLCSLTASSARMIGFDQLRRMRRSAVLLNMSRGRVVCTDALVKALKEGVISHAVLDCTDPEPLPEGHWLLSPCAKSKATILPHFATNTLYVRKQIVQDVGGQTLLALETTSNMRAANDERKKREDLATAHNITRKFGMDELVWNHMSARLEEGGFLITPGGRLFDEIAPEDLHKASSDNVTADIIHAAVYEARPDVQAIVHLHTPATVAVSCLEDGFVPLAQESAYFYNKVAVHEWEGISDDVDEKPRLMKAVQGGKSNVLLMRNHGFCTMAKSVAEAWVLAYYFDKSCRTQLEVMKASGGKLRPPPAAVMEHASKQAYLPEFAPGVCEWEALKRLVARGNEAKTTDE